MPRSESTGLDVLLAAAVCICDNPIIAADACSARCCVVGGKLCPPFIFLFLFFPLRVRVDLAICF